MKAVLAFLLATTAFLTGALPAAAQQFPALTGRVTDAADIIPADVEARLTQKLEALEQQSQRQFVVATIPSLEGYDIADYGYRLGREWGIGDKQRNDGALLIVAPNERKLRIEVGYDLEGVLTDGLSSLIINQQIVPRFRDGDVAGGIETGADAVIAQLSLPPEEAARIAQDAQAATPEVDYAFLAFVIFLLFMTIGIPILRAVLGFRRKKYGPGGIGSVILWNVADGLANARSSSGGSGGFGGGFSGGGGSFGGGGASGSW
ncbi:MAG: methanol dehydrogenase [Alphaproteobacteria bacterium]|nr:methanol dehydrogenase [Alphaproteobacteria bacterium]